MKWEIKGGDAWLVTLKMLDSVHLQDLQCMADGKLVEYGIPKPPSDFNPETELQEIVETELLHILARKYNILILSDTLAEQLRKSA